MPRPSTNTIRDTHRIFAHEVCVLTDLHRPTELVGMCLYPAVESPKAVAAGDAMPPGPLGDAVCADIEVIASPMTFFTALWGRGLGGFCRVDEERR